MRSFSALTRPDSGKVWIAQAPRGGFHREDGLVSRVREQHDIAQQESLARRGQIGIGHGPAQRVTQAQYSVGAAVAGGDERKAGRGLAAAKLAHARHGGSAVQPEQGERYGIDGGNIGAASRDEIEAGGMSPSLDDLAEKVPAF